mgnify:CR=1 FL=1
MYSLSPSARALFYWEIRLILIMLPFAVVSVATFGHYRLIWSIFTLCWGLAYLFFSVFYYPVKFRRLKIQFSRELLTVKSGVIYTRLRYAPLPSIQYVEIITFPLQAAMGMCSIRIRCAGYSIWLSSFAQKQAYELKDLLAPISKSVFRYPDVSEEDPS